MKNLKQLIILTAIGLFIANYSFAYKNKTDSSGVNNKSTNSIAAGCMPATGSTYLDINNVRALIHTGGDMWWDLVGNPEYEIPKGSGKTALFAGSIWIGGVDVNEQLRLCAQRFRQVGVDYWTGPLITSGPERASVTPDVCEEYDRHFVVYRDEVAKFRAWCHADAETRASEYEGYQVPDIIVNWPAHGDVAAGYDYYLAPFHDEKGNGFYNHFDCDYPFYDLDGELPCGTTRDERKPRLYGDMTLWWVYNDKGNIHTETGGTAIGMEIRAQAFAFATNDELNNMTFGNYELINRSTYTLNETYFGIWTDADMGYAWDDYVGCDVSRGLGYLYNGNECDGTGATNTYGCQPPAIGVDFFEGPYQDKDELDNLSNWDNNGKLDCIYGYRKDTDHSSPTYEEKILIDIGDINNGNINGLNFGDGIVDNERWGMRRFIYFNNTGNANMTDPQTAIEYYQYLLGRWKDNSCLQFGGTGYFSGGPCSDFMFPGRDPNTDPCGWGTGGVPQGPWSEETENNPVGDRRFVQSAGPFTLEPGMVNDITIGMVWARATSGGAWASVAEVQRADDKAQRLFENCFKILNGPDAPEIDIIELDRELVFHIWNKAGSNNYLEQYIERDPFIVCPVDSQGNPTDCDKYYKFEGYHVFQLKDKNVSVADIHNPDLAREVFQCDIKNFVETESSSDLIPIGQLVNYEWSNELNANVPIEEVNGANQGISHSFRIIDDMFAAGDKRLVNHKRYYFVALAYGYNDYLHYDQNDPATIQGQKKPYKAGRKGAEGAIKTYEAIPHINAPENNGTILNSNYGDQPEITQIDGFGGGYNLLELTEETINEIMSGSPWKAEQITYKAGYGPIKVKVVDPLNVPDGEYIIGIAPDSINIQDYNTRDIKPLTLRKIDTITDYGGGKILVTVLTAHDYYIDDIIRLAGTTEYDGDYTIIDTTANTTFTVTKNYDYSDTLKTKGISARVKDNVGKTGYIYDTRWFITDITGETIDTIFSDTWISYNDEKLIPELGLSVNINQIPLVFMNTLEMWERPDIQKQPAVMKEPLINNGFIGASMEFSDITKPWLWGIPDGDGLHPFNWIRSGTYYDNSLEDADPRYDDYHDMESEEDRDWLDPTETYEKIIARYSIYANDVVNAGGIWAPYRLCANSYGGKTNNYGGRVLCSPAYDHVINDLPNLYNEELRYFRLASVDIIITSDKSKWTRAPVIEMCENDKKEDIDFPWEVLDITPLKNSFSENGALRFDLRKAPSVDKNGHNQDDADVNYDEATMNGTQVYTQEDLDNGIIDDPALIGYSYGMGWFPGYAIDIETGERLNIMFGEDSKLIGCNGRDMLWNPTFDIMTYLYQATSGAQGEVLFGGKHYIYIMGNNIRENVLGSAKWETFPSYDEGKKIKDYIDEAANASAAIRRKIIRRLFRNAMWVSIPLHNSEYEFLSTDVTIKLRVANPYYKNLIHFNTEQYDTLTQNEKDSLQYLVQYQEDSLSPNYNYPMYSFSTEKLSTTKNDNETAEDALDIIKVVPNPYYGYCAYEKEQIENLVKFTNLPQKCTISIYTVSGSLVRRFKKDNPLTFVEWDLKNTYGIAIASGVYIIHIEAPGIGEKILKWFGALRPIDLQTF